VLSGTFNPPTLAHTELAALARRQFDLHEVVFVLPLRSPHKACLEASWEDRAEMLRLAVEDQPMFAAALTTAGLFLDIHRVIARFYPASTRMFFLTGRDAAERILLEWPYPDPERALAEMFARFELIVADRLTAFEVPANSLAARYRNRLHRLRLPPELGHLSADKVRRRLARKEPIQDLVDPRVRAYIEAHGLYSPELD